MNLDSKYHNILVEDVILAANVERMPRPRKEPSKKRKRVDMRLPLPPKHQWKQLLARHGFRTQTEYFEWCMLLLVEGGTEKAVDEILRIQVAAERAASQTFGTKPSESVALNQERVQRAMGVILSQSPDERDKIIAELVRRVKNIE